MKTIQSKSELTSIANFWHKQGFTVALVPTMGYLHEGHLSLIKLAKQNADKVIVSVFVNPTQFGPNEDFASYPRDENRDLSLCEHEGADVVFLPTPEEMYGTDSTVSLTESKLSKVMCGVTRPIHFAGVLTVVNKLFNISRADIAVFGMKDAQQLAIINKMVKDLDIPIKIIPAPIVREEDGLAKSSRNTYLSEKERKDALCLHNALSLAQSLWQSGNTSTDYVINKMEELINSTDGACIDYIVAVDKDTLEPVSDLKTNTLIALAVKIGKTRLIDNIVL